MTPHTFSTITTLQKDEVFVFGSNESGFHGAGAAGLAMRNSSYNDWRDDKKFKLAMNAPVGHPDRIGHWAVYGVGRGHQVGLNGESYAIATVTRPGARRSVPLAEIGRQLAQLWDWALKHPEKTIYCAINGGGYNGYTKQEIASVYPKNIPTNVRVPQDLKQYFNNKILTYTGVGSRATPKDIQQKMTKIAQALGKKGYILRSGGAQGADKAFENGATLKQIFYADDPIPDWCFVTVQKYTKQDGIQWDKVRPYVKKLIARDMLQVLGVDGNSPSQFLICWTPGGKEVGGTRYAIRCAKDHGITVYNLALTETLEQLRELYKSL